MFNNINRQRFGKIKKSVSLKQYQQFYKEEEILEPIEETPENNNIKIWEVLDKPEDKENFDNFNPIKKNYDTNTVNVDEEMKKIDVMHQFMKNISIKKLKNDSNKYKREI